ncbi:UDP-2,4-diacetamido-2,4, 6-trideoxy-beta-L-altropyranose hydrolase [Achromobacter veterisilvae]|uniref:UDP-2,4-diacetamido-2,4, 6-trideoxy-beta-L-altropyranose hydrolase n=2 Tax=Achromobacter veterisilvae TaxID=2069367 RepID=A0A446CPL6_9BURK|nr:UDP-2,4-diacetamido-2,4, 6-trideoxy-beta-L-altropyranose hydrolase [Achromobacter veterisilvae]
MMRCLALADGIAQRGGQVHFLVRRHPSHLGDLIEAKGYILHWLVDVGNEVGEELGGYGKWLGVTQAQDRDASAQVLSQVRPDWLIVDHYALDAEWETPLRRWVGGLMAIDDLADRDHDCDVLLDQNYFRDPNRYQGRVPAHCIQLLGPGYALLRPEFHDLRRRNRVRDGKVSKILVAFGGMDQADYTGRFLEAFEPRTDECSIDVVIGGGNPQRARLQSLCASRPDVRLHIQSARMAELIAKADLVVGASGTSNWERFCLGAPAIAVAVAENQVPVLCELEQDGLVLGVSPESPDQVADCVNLVKYALHQPALLRGLSRRAAALVDGRGVQRLIRQLLPASIALRRAGPDDCLRIYAWRNAPETREHSHASAPIDLSTHQSWFDATLRHEDRVLLIAEIVGEPVAVVRFDLAGARAMISIYLTPGNHGKGLGGAVIREATHWLFEWSAEISHVVAEVRAGNNASLNVFRDAQFKLDYSVFIKTRN